MHSNYVGRALLLLGLFGLLALFSFEAFSADLNVIDVRRNIPLSDSEPVIKDFYLSGGTSAGMKPNMTVTAVRSLEVKDATGNQSFGPITVPVGQLKIIAVYEKVAIARLIKLTSRDSAAMLEQAAIMTGDKIELK